MGGNTSGLYPYLDTLRKRLPAPRRSPMPKVTDAGLKELTALKELQTLDLTGTQVTDSGVAALQKALPDCKIIR